MNEEGIPMPPEPTTSYIQCLKKFYKQDKRWRPDEIISLLFILRFSTALFLGFILGYFRVRIIIAEFIFVVISASVIPKYVIQSLNMNIYALFESPASVMRENTISIYIFFTTIWLLSGYLSHSIQQS